jgi:phosphoribosyl-ATP pyrophosphohydrolase/phosphoribosyl-AMP cyclohydrolase
VSQGEGGSELPEVKWDERGLVAAICQDAATGQVLMLAWVNEEALRLTLEKGTVHFWSRSRREIWHKGETSGNYLNLLEARLDCDGDALLFHVRPEGPACHTGEMSCFFNEIDAPGIPAQKTDPLRDRDLLVSIYRLILERRDAGETSGSYVARLFERGPERILEKLEEEAEEVARAVLEETQERVVEETADLWFHSLVALAAADVPPDQVFAELNRRFGKGGRAESQ